jgi:hypothetical protein
LSKSFDSGGKMDFESTAFINPYNKSRRKRRRGISIANPIDMSNCRRK